MLTVYMVTCRVITTAITKTGKHSNRCWQFDLWFLYLFKSSLNVLKFSVHVLLNAGLENFEHCFASVWDECNYAVVWTLFGIAFLWDWNENWHFPLQWLLLTCPICQHINCRTLTALSFRIWNSSTGIPSLLLALFVVMLPKIHIVCSDAS